MNGKSWPAVIPLNPCVLNTYLNDDRHHPMLMWWWLAQNSTSRQIGETSSTDGRIFDGHRIWVGGSGPPMIIMCESSILAHSQYNHGPCLSVFYGSILGSLTQGSICNYCIMKGMPFNLLLDAHSHTLYPNRVSSSSLSMARVVGRINLSIPNMIRYWIYGQLRNTAATAVAYGLNKADN